MSEWRTDHPWDLQVHGGNLQRQRPTKSVLQLLEGHNVFRKQVLQQPQAPRQNPASGQPHNPVPC